MKDLQPLIDRVETVIPGFGEDNKYLLPVVDCVLSSRVLPDYQKAVLLQCELAVDAYAAVLSVVAEKLGIPALGLCRNLFELSNGTVYLAKNPTL